MAHPASMRPAWRILVVDDEAHIRDVVAHYLRDVGFEVVEAADGLSALALLEAQPVDLLVLDLLLPGLSGQEVCRQVRARGAGPSGSAVPILMLTALGDEGAKLDGFALGADDYVTKPFSPREVVVRVQAILRRMEAVTAPAMVLDGAIHCASLVIQPATRLVEREGLPLDVTAREFDLLHFLARHPNQIFTRQQLLDAVWGFDYFGDSSTVTVHIRRLREKIERDPAHPIHLKTVWSVGYKFEP